MNNTENKLEEKYKGFVETGLTKHLYLYKSNSEYLFAHRKDEAAQIKSYLDDREFENYITNNRHLKDISLEDSTDVWNFLKSEDLGGLFSRELMYEVPLGEYSLDALKYAPKNSRTFLVDSYVLTVVDEYGGEGMGDDYYFVLLVEKGEEKKYYKIYGYYTSYNGGYLDSIREVVPEETIKIEWRSKK